MVLVIDCNIFTGNYVVIECEFCLITGECLNVYFNGVVTLLSLIL